MPLLFVYGSLKEGFPNFHVNRGHRVPGEYRTVERYPFYLVDDRLPCLFLTPGTGLQVIGQLFEVDDPSLRAMDDFERVGRPGGYRRELVHVVSMSRDASPARTAFVYVQDPALLADAGSHVGPLAEYSIEHAGRLHW
jgi:gamma-glutamylaminecyclotransferase